jgi:hypothetical protein
MEFSIIARPFSFLFLLMEKEEKNYLWKLLGPPPPLMENNIKKMLLLIETFP